MVAEFEQLVLVLNGLISGIPYVTTAVMLIIAFLVFDELSTMLSQHGDDKGGGE